MGWLGATGLASAWVVTLAVLIVGLTAGKAAGLAAAVLALILFTVHLGTRVLLRLLYRDAGARPDEGRLVNWLKGLSFLGKTGSASPRGSSTSGSRSCCWSAASDGKNDEFKPQNEFKLDNWIPIHLGPLDLSINRAVLYLFLASALTIWAMVYIARHMQMKPNRTQAAVEAAYDLTKNNITGGNLPASYAAKWFPFLGDAVLLHRLLEHHRLPAAADQQRRAPVDIFGLGIPRSRSMPRRRTSRSRSRSRWSSGSATTSRESGRRGSSAICKSFLPAGLEDMNPIGKALIFVIELLSQFMRLVSLSVRLFANILAGHLLLLFMGGGLAVLLGLSALGALTFPLAFVFFVLEVGLIATLQAFIFATLSAIYIGGAVAETH